MRGGAQASASNISQSLASAVPWERAQSGRQVPVAQGGSQGAGQPGHPSSREGESMEPEEGTQAGPPMPTAQVECPGFPANVSYPNNKK